MSDNVNNNTDYSSPPQHRLHNSDQPLPGSGAPGAAQTKDYSPENIRRLSSGAVRGETGSNDSGVQFSPAGRAAGNVYETSGYDTGRENSERSVDAGTDQPQGGEGRSAYNSERSLGGAPASEEATETKDYSPDNIHRRSSGAVRGETGRNDSGEESSPAGRAAGNVYETSGYDTGRENSQRSVGAGAYQPQGGEGRPAYNSERPLGVAPVSEGGVAVGGQSSLPASSGANFADKVRGKTEKVIGKATKNPEMHEKGELREAGGKAAAEGRARAPHD